VWAKLSRATRQTLPAATWGEGGGVPPKGTCSSTEKTSPGLWIEVSGGAGMSRRALMPGLTLIRKGETVRPRGDGSWQKGPINGLLCGQGIEVRRL